MSAGDEAFRAELRRLRELERLTCGDVGDLAGVTKQVVSGWERGLSRPSMEVFDRLLEFLPALPAPVVFLRDAKPDGGAGVTRNLGNRHGAGRRRRREHRCEFRSGRCRSCRRHREGAGACA